MGRVTEFMPCGWWICKDSLFISGPYETEEKAQEQLDNLPNWNETLPNGKKDEFVCKLKQAYAQEREDFYVIEEPTNN